MSSVRQENRYRRLVRFQTDLKTQELIQPPPLLGIRRQPVYRSQQSTSRRQVRAWMRRAIADEGYSDATHLAEAANANFDLPEMAMSDSDHWVWEEAIKAFEEATW